MPARCAAHAAPPRDDPARARRAGYHAPTPSRYGSGAHIFDSPTFYDVSPPDANEVRTFIPHTLVGMHVVGSTKGHPEMIWASFEHFGNSPNADYTYNATSGPNPKTVSQSTSGTWLFAATGSLRFRPWGKDSGNSSASSNTEVISINNSVRGQLPAADMRNNYFMLGSTWTIGGAAPTSGNQVGTNKLANSTLETYAQGTDSTPAGNGSNCFDCHTTSTATVSHVYGFSLTDGLKPLF